MYIEQLIFKLYPKTLLKLLSSCIIELCYLDKDHFT